MQLGPHKAETSNAPNLEDGFAEFDESLVLPVTFYHDIKKEKYLQKQANKISLVFQVMLILL